MADTFTKEFFLKLLDDAESLFSSDYLKEWHDNYSYSLTAKEDEEKKEEELISSCHKCEECFSRTLYAEPIINSNSKIFFILAYPEGDMLLSSQSSLYFSKWLAAMGLQKSEVSLSTLIKCPAKSFKKSSADICKGYLKDEIKSANAKALVLLGEELSSYMLRKNLPLTSLRGRSYSINGITTFCTYSLEDLSNSRALRAPIWEDLKLVMAYLDSIKEL